MSTDELRKKTPVFLGLFAYFPKALAEVARVSVSGNEQHLNGQDLHWDRGKSNQHLDSGSRHLLDHAAGEVYDNDSQRHLAKTVWRFLAQLEIELEKEGKRNFLKETSPTFYDGPKPMSAEDLEKYADSLDSKQNQALAQIDNNEY